MDWFAARAGWARTVGKDDGSKFSEAGGDTASAHGQTVLAGGSRTWVQQQQGYAIVWAPVAMVCGLMAFYSLPLEPPLLLGLITAPIMIGLAVAVRTEHMGGIAVFAAFLVAGFLLGQVATHAKGTRVLPGSTGKVTVSGWIDDLGHHSGKRRRMIVDVDRIDEVKQHYWPGKARLSARVDHVGTHIRGDYVRFQAWLYPPLTPAAPGGWDYGRIGWFAGIGAGGRVASKLVKPGGKADRRGWFDRLAELRAGIAQRVRVHLAEREAGFAVALITGERGGLDKSTREALQLSGLAHILAISGLHMSLVAGGVFWFVRAMLALWPHLALNCPIKKIAALVGLSTAGFYLLISGQAIATQRAFIMLVVMFLAVLLGRSAISMRNLAVAAIIVLLIAPHAVLTPSFQMSFLAVMGLIAGYEFLAGRPMWLRQRMAAQPVYLKALILVVLVLTGLSTTTIIASVFTTLPAAFHFNRFATWSLPANLLAMPIVTFVVMPAAVVAVCLMPIGLEYWPLQVMSTGLQGVQATAFMVSGWPGAAKVAGAMWPQMAFVAGMALCFLALWRGALRWFGAALAVAAGFAAIALGPRPDLLIERTAVTMAARMQDGNLVPVYSRRGRFAIERWLLADGDDAKPLQAAKRPGWSCAMDACRGQIKNKSVLWLGRKAVPPENCKDIDIVISANPLRRQCGYPTRAQLHVDRFDVWRNGAHSILVTNDGDMHLETARRMSGSRAWVYKPVARRKILMVDPGPWIDRSGADAAINGKASQ